MPIHRSIRICLTRFFGLLARLPGLISGLLILLLSMSAYGQDRLTLESVIEDGVNGVDGLEGVWHSAISPDGNHLYAAGFDENKIAVFQRDQISGALTFVEVLANGVDGVSGLGWVGFILVSPDGDYVYAASWDDDAVVVFSRNSTSGELTFLEVHVDFVNGVSGINRATSIAMSQDGEQVYVTGNASHRVTTFDRDPSTGLLTYVSQFGNSRLSSARSVVVSPDDAHVYVGASFYGAITVFDRDPTTGALTFNEVHEDGVNGVDGLSSLFWITLSDDGAFLYAASPQDDAIALFSRDSTTGKLTFIEMYKDKVNGVEGLNGATSIAISPDGDSVIATAQFDGLTLFDRDPATGQLTFVETHDSADLNYASGAVFGPATAPASPAAFLAPPSSKNLYISAAYSHALSQWKVDPKLPASEDPTAESNASFPQASTHLDPINTFNGELFSHKPTDLDLGGPMPLTFGRYYSSYLRRSFILGDLGSNWRHNFDARLFEGGDGNMKYVSADGRVVEFIKDLGTGAYDQSTGLDTPFQLSKPAGQDATLYDPSVDRIYTFDFTTSSVIIGKLAVVEDGHGNVHTITYDLANGHIDTVADGLGRQFTFTYNNDLIPKISVVSDGMRSVSFEYTDLNDDEALTVVTDARGFATTYAYKDTSANADHALMLYMTRPEGNAPYVQTFFDTNTPLDSGKVATQTDADGNTHSIAYNGTDTTLTDPLGNTRVHTHTSTGEFSNRQDETGLSFSMGSDTMGRRNSLTDRLGDTSSMVFDAPSGKVTDITNADGTINTFSYTPRTAGDTTFYDLATVNYADGTVESFVYDAMGNLISHTNQAGSVATATFAANGQPSSTTNTAGGISTNTYNADATLATSTDPAGNTTTLGYDTARRVNQITHEDTNSQSVTYDNANRLLTTTDENGSTVMLNYDDNGNLASIQDALLATTTIGYDGNDRATSVTDPLGGVSTLTYNAIGRIATSTDANSNQASFSYDVLGRLASMTDPLGNEWMTTYDAEEIISSRTDPLLNTTNYVSDSMGRITATTSPLGHTTEFGYDAMGRVISSTNSLNETTILGRDARGLLSSMTLPGGLITSSYTRNSFGQATGITDPNGNIWQRAYDNLGRRTSITDPLGNNETTAYDNRNRPALITFPDALGTLTQNYDPANNLTSSIFSDGTSLTYSYDVNNRLTSASGVSVTYDANGRIVDSNGISNVRDPGGRITEITLAPGKPVTYVFDANDHVIQVEDWDSGITTFAYDNAGRLTGITRPNGIDTTRSYDNDGRLSSISEGLVSSITLVRDAKGQITNTAIDAPQASSPSSLSDLASSYDAAARQDSATYDGMGRTTIDGNRSFVWNLASQLTSITTDGETTNASYDALGQRLSKTISAITRSYVWNYALGLTSVSVEREDGSDQRYYVHTPGGALLYSVDANTNARTFYHYDDMGNTIFLSDDVGTVIGSYAYGPYGQLIGTTGGLDNPFTWQGQFGTMDEGADFYYTRARYYDARRGRFVSRDPINSVDAREINPYQYALNNPLRFVDQSGQKSVDQAKLDQLAYATARYFESLATAAPRYAEVERARARVVKAKSENPHVTFPETLNLPGAQEYLALLHAFADDVGDDLSNDHAVFLDAIRRVQDELKLDGTVALFANIFGAEEHEREARLKHFEQAVWAAIDELLKYETEESIYKRQGFSHSWSLVDRKKLIDAAGVAVNDFKTAGGSIDELRERNPEKFRKAYVYSNGY